MDSVNRKKTNLRKLSFLGFGSGSKSKINQNVSGSSQDQQEVYLDEECAKVFAMDTDDDKFDLDRIHDPDKATEPMNYGENEYSLHRKKSYPHIHIPLKPNKSARKRTLSSRSDTPTQSSATADGGATTSICGTPPMVGGGSPLDDGGLLVSSTTNTETGKEADPAGRVLVGRDSVVTLLLNQDLEEDQGTYSSGSDCILSDPCGYKSPERIRRATFTIESSPDRKVQFREANCADIPEDGPSTDQDGDGYKGQGELKRTKRSRSQHTPQAAKCRKFSLPDDPNRKRHHHHHRHRYDTEKADAPLMVSGPTSDRHHNRRVSTQPEDLPLRDNDRDQLDSHRSDDQRCLRRHKTARPSNASLVHIARKDGPETNILSGSMMKKMYDHSPHAIFVELDEIFGTSEDREWKETARWIKYEEDVEEGVDRWGKPHVASLSFHSLLNLRKCLEDGVVILDMEEKDLPGIAYRISEELYKEDLIREEDKATIMRILLLRHRHVNEHSERTFRFPRKHSYSSLQNLHDSDKRKASYPGEFNNSLKNGGSHHLDPEAKLLPDGKDGATIVDMKEELYSNSNDDLKKPSNDTILKRIPIGAQGSSILVGAVDFLEQPAMAFIRLAQGVHIPSLIEVSIPVRFIFLLLGPLKANLDYHEVGRSISTLMANQQFHNIAYSADNRKALLSAINEFLDDSIVLPPGDWERQALLPIEEIKAKSERIKKRKENALKSAELDDPTKLSSALLPLLAGDDGKKPPDYPNPLERTKRPFGGLFNDLRRRYPHFKTDITDGINAQCAAAAIFMYFAALSGAITFGGLMSDKTENYIGISETLVATSVTGVLFAILSGQPLVIVGVTGPLLLFDESLYQFCKANEIDYLVIRVYIGIWLGILALIVAICEGSVLVKLFSRFTEEIFSALISLLYIVESFMKLVYVFGRHPIMGTYCSEGSLVASRLLLGSNTNDTDYNNTGMLQDEPYNITGVTYSSEGSVILYPTHDEFGKPINQPNTALFCTILALGTFAIAYYLRMFRNSQFLGRSARRALGDFGVPIAIIIMVFLDYLVPDTYTEKLSVPEGLSPSNPAVRGWFINPAEPNKPFPLWIIFACCIPALLVYILLFMETHICELIMDKKERKLKKGSGFHLDIVLISLMNVGCGFLGFPWICAATVRSVAHISAVTVMSRTHAPGEKPHIIEVKEQRVSSLAVSVLVGLSVLMAPLLRLVPMSVLFGVFLYMGVSSTDGIQFFDRLKLFFMPVKHHPQTNYVRKVKTIKMHLFTFLQLMCLVILWVVKSTKASLAFPFFLLLMVPMRNQLRCIFSPIELRALDGDQPDVDDDEPDFYAEAPLPG